MNKFLTVLSMVQPALEAANVMEQLGDACLDALEEFVQRTDNKVDDAILLPALKGLRFVAGIAKEQEKTELEVVK